MAGVLRRYNQRLRRVAFRHQRPQRDWRRWHYRADGLDQGRAGERAQLARAGGYAVAGGPDVDRELLGR